MTEPGIYYPPEIYPSQLDVFLAKGWYRMGQGIFTTNYIFQNNLFYRVFWLRYDLAQLSLGKKQQRILDINKKFTSRVVPFKLTAEMEDLFSLYKTGIDFEPASSVKNWLYDDGDINIYDSYLVELRDEDRLIAVGIFDKGVNSIAGILNFYDPAYRRYSPGKYLMLAKIQYAKEQGLAWYYPGYIVCGYAKFDYKLFAGKNAAELYSAERNEWFLYNEHTVKEAGGTDPFSYGADENNEE
jgi:arginine-tRNA-protein transferase